jgi:hypothetical protein
MPTGPLLANSIRIRTYKKRAHIPCRINTSTASRICIKTNDFNPFRMNTYKTIHRILKTKDFNFLRINTYTISPYKSLRINTSKKPGEGGG